MNEQLITFDTAKLANKKGFIGWSEKRYNKKGTFNESKAWSISAPTQALLQKWLRELDGWPILVYVVPYLSKQPRKEQCFIWRRGQLITLEPKNTYEEALEKGLQEALKLI